MAALFQCTVLSCWTEIPRWRCMLDLYLCGQGKSIGPVDHCEHRSGLYFWGAIWKSEGWSIWQYLQHSKRMYILIIFIIMNNYRPPASWWSTCLDGKQWTKLRWPNPGIRLLTSTIEVSLTEQDSYFATVHRHRKMLAVRGALNMIVRAVRTKI